MSYLSAGMGLLPEEAGRMMRAVRRFHFATKQDSHPVVAFLHNAYSVAIMDILRDLATDDEIRRMTGEDMPKLRREVLGEQDKLQKKAEDLARKFGIMTG